MHHSLKLVRCLLKASVSLIALLFRDEALLPLAARLGIVGESQALPAGTEIYQQLFERDTEDAPPGTPEAAEARRRRLLACRAALGLTASDVSHLHANAYRVRSLKKIFYEASNRPAPITKP